MKDDKKLKEGGEKEKERKVLLTFAKENDSRKDNYINSERNRPSLIRNVFMNTQEKIEKGFSKDNVFVERGSKEIKRDFFLKGREINSSDMFCYNKEKKEIVVRDIVMPGMGDFRNCKQKNIKGFKEIDRPNKHFKQIKEKLIFEEKKEEEKRQSFQFNYLPNNIPIQFSRIVYKERPSIKPVRQIQPFSIVTAGKFKNDFKELIEKVSNKNPDYTIVYREKESSLRQSQQYRFNNLLNLLEDYYMNEIYSPSELDDLTEHETIILFKLLKKPKETLENIESLKTLKQRTKRMADAFFNKEIIRDKGYRANSNKFSLFRKIKQIMINKLIDKRKASVTLKREKDKLLFDYYFKCQKEYETLTEQEKEDLEKVFKNYGEFKMVLIWRFELFTKEFAFIFQNINEELKTVNKEKLDKLSFFLKTLEDKDMEFIRRVSVSQYSIPQSHSLIAQYKIDFSKSFSYFLMVE